MDQDNWDDLQVPMPRSTPSSASSQASNSSKKRSRDRVLNSSDFGKSIDGDEELNTPASSVSKQAEFRKNLEEILIANNIDPTAVARVSDHLASTVMTNSAVSEMAYLMEGYSASGSEASRRNKDGRRRPASTPRDDMSERDEDIYPVVENPSRPLTDYAGFARAQDPPAAARNFVDDMINGINQPPVAVPTGARNGRQQQQQAQLQHTKPSGYTAGLGVRLFDPTTAAETNRQAWKNRGGATTGNDEKDTMLDFTKHIQAGKHDDILNDREIITHERAVEQYKDLRKLHRHWEKRLHRPKEDLPDVGMTVAQAKAEDVFKRTSGNAYLLLVELVRKVNFDNLVAAGKIATHPSRLPNDPEPSTSERISEKERRRAQKQAGEDAKKFMDDDVPICTSTIEQAVIAERQRLYAVYLELTNRAPDTFTAANRREVGRLWGELCLWLDASLQMVLGFYKIRFVNASQISRLVSEMSLIELDDYKENERARFTFFMSTRMASLNFRLGPKKDWIYREHFTDGLIPSNYWIADRTIEDFVKQTISPSNGVQAIAYYNYASTRVSGIVNDIKTGDVNMFPKVNPIRGLYGFSNGILDSVENVFSLIGTEAYTKNVVRTYEYKYVYNYFDAPYNSNGYSKEDGCLDRTDRHAPYNEKGLPDWEHPEKMPKNHSSRVLKVPLLQHNIETQKWDLHTIMNCWFAFGRLGHGIGDNMQFAPFLKGVAGSGKSTFLQFPILMIPAEYRAIIQASADAVFALQLLIGTDEKFVKHLGAVCDMNGKMSIPTSLINSLITGEFVTTDVKYGDQRTARANMPFVFAGNQFFDDGPVNNSKEMPSKIRRFWQFILNTVPTVKDIQVNEQSILKSMPDYIRMTTEVYHEFWALKENSPNPNVRNSTDPWLFASPYLKNIKMNTMMGVSRCSKFISSEDWIVQTNDPNDYLSLESLRYVSHMYNATAQGIRGVAGLRGFVDKPPDLKSIEDAIRMIYPQNAIDQWGEETVVKKFETTPEILEKGLPCQLGDVVKTHGHFFVSGLQIHPERLAAVVECMPGDFTTGYSSAETNDVTPNMFTKNKGVGAATKKRAAKKTGAKVTNNLAPGVVNNSMNIDDEARIVSDATPYIDDEYVQQFAAGFDETTIGNRRNLPSIGMDFEEDPDAAQ